MNYKQAIEFLYSALPAYHRIGKAAYKNNLDNTVALDNYFGHPHLKYKTIHVAGTNGKGSVSHMIASILQEAGYRTGLYTSPHLKDFRERIRIDGKMIPEKEVVAFVEKHRGIIDEVKPSFFEMTVAMAFDYFARGKVEVAVIEVGLGGRLDSTNIINPVLSVITNIGHDHMDLLGDTLEKVAAEKAGVIKKYIPVVIGETQPGIKNIFMSKASETGSEIFFADKNHACTLSDITDATGERQFIIKDHEGHEIISGTVPLAGDYQEKNLSTVCQAIKCISYTLNISEKNLKKGIRKVIENTDLKGRWQVLDHNPLIICDTGHNLEGLEYVMKQIRRSDTTKMHFVIGFVNDKDLNPLLPLFPKNAIYYFTKAAIQRALDEKLLQAMAHKFNLSGNCYKTVNEALNAARKNASESDLIFVGGSTFVVAEVI